MRGSTRTVATAGAPLGLCSGVALAADVLIPAKIGLVKPANLAKFVAKSADGFPLPPAGDEPTTVGSSLHVFDTNNPSAGDDTYSLPAAQWKGLGNPAGSKGYKYKGTKTPGDPCNVVLVKPKVIKGVCKGSDIGLTPPFGGDEGIILSMGGTQYCAELGGTPVKNDDKMFKHKDAPAPSVCPTPAGPPLPTTTTTLPPVCGDHTVNPGETCDDGNTVDESTPGYDPIPPDTCPGNCVIQTCTPDASMMEVDVNFSSAIPAAGIKVFVDYPEGKVSIPGIGNQSTVTARILNVAVASGVSGVPNDLDYGLIEVLGSLNPIPTPRLFTINFDRCTGMPAPTAGEFSCSVKNASDVDGNDISGVTCSVSIP